MHNRERRTLSNTVDEIGGFFMTPCAPGPV